MLCLNKDVLFLILEELQDDNKSLYSCLLVNRTWCEMTVSVLWKNPGQYSITENAKSMLFDVIFLHLSEESRDILKNKGINDHLTEIYQHPSFNYINFWKYLNLSLIKSIIPSKNVENSNISIINNEILKLFINGNTKFIHLTTPRYYFGRLHQIPGFERCFAELESFHCSVKTNKKILEGLTIICKSIKKLVIENN